MEKTAKLSEFVDLSELRSAENVEVAAEEDQRHSKLCAYCGYNSPDGIMKCIDTGRWFCNGKGKSSTSHIIHHLVKSKKKTVSLHPNSALGDVVLECYNCGCRNIFVLGFVPSKSDNVAVILCRSQCLESGSLKDTDWDPLLWKPLIENKRFLSWLLRPPTDQEDFDYAGEITNSHIIKLEDCWKTGNNVVTMRDMMMAGNGPLDMAPDVRPAVTSAVAQEIVIEKARLFYDDAFHYQNIFAPLVLIESDYSREHTEAQRQDGVTVSWEVGVKNRVIARIAFTRGDDYEVRLVIGDDLRLRRGSWCDVGKVRRVNVGCVELELRGVLDVPMHVNDGFTVEFMWKPTPYERMQESLRLFALVSTCMSGYLYHVLLGHDVAPMVLKVELPTSASEWAVPGLPTLNHSQLSAIQAVLPRALSLIQGPPGTGKTVVSASIVYHLTKQRAGTILVCAPSNVAVDQLTEKIAMTGLKVVRLCAMARETIQSNIEALCLHNMILNIKGVNGDELRRLHQMKEDKGDLTDADEKRLLSLKRRFESEILNAAEVICTTCSCASDRRMSGNYPQVLIDEATQATEPELLIPIVRGCKQLILVGDHCQLGPVVMCRKAADANLTVSLFERLVMNGIRPIRLQVQYRMHPALSEFPSNIFYEGTLQNGVSEEDRKKAPCSESSTADLDAIELNPGYRRLSSFQWPLPGLPMYFHHSPGSEELAGSGTSYLNRLEAGIVETIVSKLIMTGVAPQQIGIITPYEGQRSFLVMHLQRNSRLTADQVDELEIASVDSFQGREKDFIILSCVRSNDTQEIGFLSDPRRLNVALTRAKYGLVIVGNACVLAKNYLWNSLLVHFYDREVLVDGPADRPTKMIIDLPRPKGTARDRRLLAFMSSGEIDWGASGGEQYGVIPSGPNSLSFSPSGNIPVWGSGDNEFQAMPLSRPGKRWGRNDDMSGMYDDLGPDPLPEYPPLPSRIKSDDNSSDIGSTSIRSVAITQDTFDTDSDVFPLNTSDLLHPSVGQSSGSKKGGDKVQDKGKPAKGKRNGSRAT